jgi:hypothetical protein
MTPEEFEKEAADLSERMQKEVLAEEARFEATINAPLPPRRYANTQYWEKVGPLIDGHRWSVRYDQAEKALQEATDRIAAKYYHLLLDLEGKL